MPQVNDAMRKNILELLEFKAAKGLSVPSAQALKYWLERTDFEVNNVLRLRSFLTQASKEEFDIFNRTRSLPEAEKALSERRRNTHKLPGMGKSGKKASIRLPGQPTGKRSRKR